jgi:fucose permease
MPRTPKARVLKLLLHLIFLLSGIATVLIGQVLPMLGKYFSLNDLRLSYFFPSQFAGSLCGTLLTSRFARNHDHISATIIGGVLMALGVLIINADSFAICPIVRRQRSAF